MNVPVDNARVRTRGRRASSMTCRVCDTGSEPATGSEIQTRSAPGFVLKGWLLFVTFGGDERGSSSCAVSAKCRRLCIACDTRLSIYYLSTEDAAYVVRAMNTEQQRPCCKAVVVAR